MNAVDDAEKMLFLVLSPDSTQVELFFSEEEMPNEILERRGLPAGGYVWNVEDDDTLCSPWCFIVPLFTGRQKRLRGTNM